MFRLTLSSALISIVLLVNSTVWAACPGSQPANTECVETSSNKNITAFSVCRRVTNNHASGNAIMIPIGSSVEWSTFYGNAPAGVTIGSCVSTPTITSISPSADLATGGKTVTVTGTGFVNGAAVRINGTNCSTSTFTSATQMTCVVPAVAAGTISKVDLSVVNPDTGTATLTGGFYYVGAPTLWLRADFGLTLSGSNVTGWTDQSAKANSPVGYSGTYPTRVASSASFNNMPVVNFSGTQTLEITKLDIFKGISGASAVMAIRPTSTAGDQYIFDNWNGTDGNIRFGVILKPTAGRTSFGTGDYVLEVNNVDSTQSQYIRGGTVTAGTPLVLTTIVNYTARTGEVVINGTSATSASNILTGAGTPNTNVQNSKLGGDDDLGAFFSGDMAEIFWYEIALSTAQRQVLEGYLKTRYNLP